MPMPGSFLPQLYGGSTGSVSPGNSHEHSFHDHHDPDYSALLENFESMVRIFIILTKTFADRVDGAFFDGLCPSQTLLESGGCSPVSENVGGNVLQ